MATAQWSESQRTAKVLEKFDALRVWQQKGKRAPHKPLLVLWALGQWQSHRGTEFPFSLVEKGLGALLREFGPPRKPEPKFPFVHLQSDGVWNVRLPASHSAQSSIAIRSARLLRESKALGGFSEDVISALSSDPQLLDQIATRVLGAHFPASIHQDLLDAVGLQVSGPVAKTAPLASQRNRDPSFRERVLRTYERRCAVCGLDVRIGGIAALLEASHIQWFQADGPDVESNGLALCPLHHKMFDLGCFTLTEDLRIEVSDDVTGGDVFEEVLGRYHAKFLRQPVHEEHLPSRIHVAWHRREVFKGVGR